MYRAWSCALPTCASAIAVDMAVIAASVGCAADSARAVSASSTAAIKIFPTLDPSTGLWGIVSAISVPTVLLCSLETHVHNLHI